MASGVIELKGLTKQYGDYKAVNNLDLSIEKGEVFGLLGPNGAGKSTTILMLMGMTEPTLGSVRVCGIDPSRNPIDVKRKVGYLPEDVGFYDDRTGAENLMYSAMLNGLSEAAACDKANQMLEKVQLLEEGNKKVGRYSRGMRQRLGLADTLIKSPEIIILDEPTLGIDPKGVKELLALIKGLSKEENLTVLLSSHHLHQVQQVCDQVGLFVRGQLIAEGNLETLSNTLFPNMNREIEVRVSSTNGMGLSGLVEKVQTLESVEHVAAAQNVMTITCARDISETIARLIVESGAGLSSLHQKAFGLDEIYQRYFETEKPLVKHHQYKKKHQ